MSFFEKVLLDQGIREFGFKPSPLNKYIQNIRKTVKGEPIN